MRSIASIPLQSSRIVGIFICPPFTWNIISTCSASSEENKFADMWLWNFSLTTKIQSSVQHLTEALSGSRTLCDEVKSKLPKLPEWMTFLEMTQQSKTLSRMMFEWRNAIVYIGREISDVRNFKCHIFGLTLSYDFDVISLG